MATATSLRSRRRPRHPADTAMIVNIHAAKTQLSRLLARVERGERITIARAGLPVAVLAPPSTSARPPVPPDDPLFNVDQFGFDGPGGSLPGRDIDRLVYGS